MPRILLATARPRVWEAFVAALSSQPEVQVQQVASGAEALEAVQGVTPHLVIVDAGLPDAAPLELVRRLLPVNALVNTAVVSPLSEEAFHEASEGLGVLCRLPEEPGAPEAAALLHKLRLVLGNH